MSQRRWDVLFLGVMMAAILFTFAACDMTPSSSDVQRDRQEKQVGEAVAQVGLPAIKNFREMKLAKDLLEMRDQTGLTTYAYLWSEMQGKLVFFCESIGYPLPYSTQFTAPEAVQRWYLLPERDRTREWGHEKLPQPEPNGLFSPPTAEASWVMCKDPGGKDVRPVYVEPRLIVSQFPLTKEPR